MEQSLSIYKASAGSGKTFTLAVEYIMGLLLPHAEKEFEHILAVTFTNKATAEMKGRILETLYGLKMGLKESDDYMDAILKRFEEAKIPITKQQVRERAGLVLTAILHDYSHFRVETIDSFFQSILRNMARELGLAANLQVELSHDEIINSAVDSLIETMDSQPEVKQWVENYVHEQLDNGDKWDIVKPLKGLAGTIFEEEYQQRSEEELARISNTKAVSDFKRKMQNIKKCAQEDIEKAADEVMALIDDFGIISNGKNVLSFLLKTKAMDKKTLCDGPSATIRGQADGSKALYNKDGKSKEADPVSDDIRNALSHLITLCEERRKEYFSAILALQKLVSLRLLEHINEKVREIEGEAGRFTLSSTPALLGKMVEGNDAPFIFEKIGTYINHVMIDEFQDTSRMQWENFKKLLFEKLASGGKGLLVGDIKQSIYRWRGGDWNILHKITEEKELRRFHIHPIPLDTNYRSHQVIVDFNNDFFPPAAQLLDDIEPDADIKLKDIYADIKQIAKKNDKKGYVRVKLYKEADKETYQRETILDMAEQIKALQENGLSLDQIAILVRKRKKTASLLIDMFAKYAPDIRLVSDEAFLLEASIGIQMIIAALRLLIDKQHTDGISEKYLMLHYLRDVQKKEETTLQDIAAMTAKEVLPEAFAAHQEELLQLPLYLLVEKLWHIFSLTNISGEDIYILTFFDELQNYLRSGKTPDIQSFLTYWDEKLHSSSIPVSSVAGVRILTIHKSKGLEFHTVFLPFSDWEIEKDIQQDGQPDVLWCRTNEAPFNELGTLPIPCSSTVKTTVFAPDYEEEHLERRVDALNTLYVAFTRPKANLYIWGKIKELQKCESNDNASELIYLTLRNNDNDTNNEHFTYEIGEPLVETKKEEKETENRLCLKHKAEDAVEVAVVARNPVLNFMQSGQAQDYLQQLNEEDEEDTTAIKLSQREVGKRMHEVLSRIDDACQIEEVLGQAKAEGLIGEGEDWEAITSRIAESFQNPLIASWFQSENTVYNECAIASIDKDKDTPCVLRPDRVVMNGSNITVIDYKFGHPNRHYYDQVKEYMNLMKQMYPTHNVQGYIWYIMGKGPIKVK